jgi:hypothetical protein
MRLVSKETMAAFRSSRSGAGSTTRSSGRKMEGPSA